MSASAEVAYGDLTFTETHPTLTSALAALRGLQPPPVETARILELGCGTGFNLLAIAQSLPAARCTGIDYSPVHIQRATATAAAIHATNVEFHTLSIDAFHPPPHSFDYIIAHGVYSWVPPRIREAILALCQHALSPNGIAYISYNTYPGWHLRSLIRDGLRFFAHTPNAVRSMDLLNEGLINPKSVYAHALSVEWDDARRQPGYYLAHEYLVPDCQPFFFADFMRDAAAHDLQFLAESRFQTNAFAQPEHIEAHLEPSGPDLIRREQHLDWLAGRYFRQTLLCHAGANLYPEPDQTAVLDLTVIRAAESSEDLFCQQILDQISPSPSLPASQLELPEPFLAPVLWSGWRAGLWDLRTPTAALPCSPTPLPLACIEATDGPVCTNRFHRKITLTPEERELLLTPGAGPPARADLLRRYAL